MFHSIESVSENANGNLIELIDSLPKHHSNMVIEYGIKDHPGSPLSGFRIRRINTAGGLQFKLSKIYHGRGETTLLYTPNSLDVHEAAVKAVIEYHKPTPLREKINELRQRNGTHHIESKFDKLEWFAYDPKDVFVRSLTANTVDELQEVILPGVKNNDIETINLS